MSSVFEYMLCLQCGFPYASHVFNCRTREHSISCQRCGYAEWNSIVVDRKASATARAAQVKLTKDGYLNV